MWSEDFIVFEHFFFLTFYKFWSEDLQLPEIEMVMFTGVEAAPRLQLEEGFSGTSARLE